MLTMEQVPSAELIKNWVGAFLVDAENIKGVYRNLDVDSLVFTYHTSAQTEEDFCNALALSLEKSKWQRTSNCIDFIEFRRTSPTTSPYLSILVKANEQRE